MGDKLSGAELYNTAVEAQKATEEACGRFPPFEGLAQSIQLKKAAKSVIAQIGEAYGRHNAGDRIRLLRLAGESVEQLLKGLGSALKSKLFKQEECDGLKEAWGGVSGQIDTYVEYLEAGGEMEAPLPQI